MKDSYSSANKAFLNRWLCLLLANRNSFYSVSALVHCA